MKQNIISRAVTIVPVNLFSRDLNVLYLFVILMKYLIFDILPDYKIYYNIYQFSDHEVVFVKEMAFAMTDKLEDTSYFPRNFRHTFLIRHPSKAVPSYLRLCTRNKSTGKYMLVVKIVKKRKFYCKLNCRWEHKTSLNWF